ncbi:sister chromatid separation protein-like protein [Rhizodiscina lignyota]|uniref:Sister chromatid separation protein-like protein n=1 Tax=Rhizodiscina lignyota TaxID=1504668 RepID=A0A9P4IIX0_9PEZI|nr:sister chromatid separation protein-like protein [Rhizodiscina lignyota]
MADEDLEYLSPGFDPASLTVPKLRSILVQYNVGYPSSAKKAQLVDLFHEHVTPQAKRILSSRARTKPSSRGIKDVPSSQASAVDEDEEENIVPQPLPSTTAGKRKSRRVTAGPTDVEQDETQAPARRISGKHARASDAETDGQPVQRRSRKSAVTPAAKLEERDPVAWHNEDGESPFTSDNPFQSGKKRKSSANRRRTDNYTGPQADGAVVPTSKTFEIPLSHLKKKQEIDEDDVEIGEEFTPDEQLELVRERAENGNRDVLPPRRRKQASKGAGIVKVGTSAFLIAMLGGLATVWRQEKLEVGYCGVGRPSTSLGGVEIPEWAQGLQPQCEPCPPHAYCYADLKTECEPDFILRPHPLSLGGLVPIPPTCEPDSEKSRRVQAVADRAIEELRERNAQYECGELKNDQGKGVPPEIKEEELKEVVSTKRRKGMSQEEFDDLWNAAVGDILNRDEVISGSRTLASTSLARLPLSCAIRRSFRQALARHLWKLVAFLVLVASGVYMRHSITSGKETEERAKQLASYALDRLATQASLHAQDSQSFPEAYIGMGHLRDDILRNEFSASRRTKLWAKVQTKVEQNSNVRPMVREGRSGDVGRVWEWVGPLTAVEDGRSGGRRESSRYSLGVMSNGSAPNSSPMKGDGSEISELRSWNEGRPIY